MPSAEVNKDAKDVGNLNGQGRAKITAALQQLFERHPEASEQTSVQIAEDLYIWTDLGYKPDAAEVEAALEETKEGESV